MLRRDAKDPCGVWIETESKIFIFCLLRVQTNTGARRRIVPNLAHILLLDRAELHVTEGFEGFPIFGAQCTTSGTPLAHKL